MSVSRIELSRLLQDAHAAVTEEWDDYAERVLEAAEQQFSEFGLRRTSMDRVAEAAGVSRITLYRRFANRDALLAAVVVREFRRYIAEFDAAVSPIIDPHERFVRGVAVAGVLFSQDSLLQRLLRTDPTDTLPLLTTDGSILVLMARDYVRGHLGRARDEGMPISGDLEMIAELLVRVAHSMLLTPDSTLDADEERLADFARRSIMPMLFGIPNP
ncbi:TetR family transcriptional regulator [Mycobacterium sp. SM3041]|uniref:TetR/AcrR family transcriptional regulator n=1 Tax=Mycobacterium sp. SM3041 TaxID=3114291 RepID=UPI003204C3D1